MTMLAQILLLVASTVTAGQGNALRLTLPNETGISAVSILWQNKTIPYVRVDNEWVAVIGVDLDIKAGSYPSTIRVTKKGASGDAVERRPLTILVKAVKYPTTELKAVSYTHLTLPT